MSFEKLLLPECLARGEAESRYMTKVLDMKRDTEYQALVSGGQTAAEVIEVGSLQGHPAVGHVRRAVRAPVAGGAILR